MKIQNIFAHWVALHESLGVGRPLANEAEYERAMALVAELVDTTGDDNTHPLWGLIAVMGDQIKAYEDQVHPWPDHTTAAEAP